MLHKTDKGPVYGVRGVMHFFKEKSRFLPNRKRTHEKTYVFSHALVFYLIMLSFSIFLSRRKQQSALHLIPRTEAEK